nr:CDF family Co(II)/Ni(II) efflux transporter DmeF [Labrys monachus]
MQEVGHDHVFLGAEHDSNERRTWAVIVLCLAMMAAEIVGGALFGSIALVADGLHMSTHAGALLLTALAYRYARRYARDRRFTFGTGKFGDLAGYTSAIVLAMIAVLIAYEALNRLLAPIPIDYAEAILIASVGLAVNIASAWLLSGGHHHHHGHEHPHGHGAHHHDDETRRIETGAGPLVLSIFEDGVPPRFRLRPQGGALPGAPGATIETLRPDGARQVFALVQRDGFLESADAIPEPHAFTVHVRLHGEDHVVGFAEHAHDAGQHDNNLRSALAHVVADAAVSVLVIIGLLLGRIFGWAWMDPVAGLVGAAVIVSWSWTLIRDTSRILMDMIPDRGMADAIRATMETGGDRVTDLHLWRLGPGHIGAILSVSTPEPHEPGFYRRRLAGFPSLSHVTIEVQPRPRAA